MVIAGMPGESPEAVTGELIKSLHIAQLIAGEIKDGAPAKESAPVLFAPPKVVRSAEDGQPASLTIFAKVDHLRDENNAAPPVAGASAAPENETDPDADYWESRPGAGDGCQRLTSHLRQYLPPSLSLPLPGFDQPLELVLGIGSPGLRFVHVSYSLPGDPLGTRVTLMTSQKTADPAAIVADITAQAAAIYSKEKRVLQPAPIPRLQPPSTQDLQNMLNRDRQQQSQAPDQDAARIASQWAQDRHRSPRWS